LKGGAGKPVAPQSLYSEANILTLIRLILSLVFYILAILKRNPGYNYIGFIVHSIGDFIDGFYARKFKQETLFGAELDIIADRLEMIFFYFIFLHFRPYLFLPVAMFLVNYAFVDFYLSYQFVKYDIISINYFYKVDRLIFLLNFSNAAKLINATFVALLLIFLPQLSTLVTIFAMLLIAVKSYSIYRLYNLGRT